MVAAMENNKLLKFIIYWLPVILCAGLISYLSSIPGDDVPELFENQDIILHIIEYAVLAFFVNRAVIAYFNLSYTQRFLWIFIFCLFYAILDEWHQSFVLGREPALIDVVNDSIGVFLTNLFYK